MKQNNQFELDSFLISLIIHVGILICFGLISYNVQKKNTELFVEWLTDPKQEVVQEDFAPQGDTQSNDTSESTNPVNNVNSEQIPIAEQIATQPTTAKSIEPPVRRPVSNVNSAPKPGTSSSYLAGIKSNIRGATSQGGSGYQLDNPDGNIVVIKQVLPKPNINDFGKVTLQFKINQDGTVNGESILPVQIDDPNYTNASIAALKQWIFSYKAFISSKVYRISFIFKPE